MRRVAGLDAWRFIAAVWVALSHGAGIPADRFFASGTFSAYLLHAVGGIAFNGTAAVAVFFVISGFCIHFPNAELQKLDIVGHLMRRYIRIGIPLAVTTAIIFLSDARIGAAGADVLWSIYCELVYYTIYPLIFYVFRRVGIIPPLIASFIVSFIIIASHWTHLYYWEFGWEITWIVGFPSWLLGCLLARNISKNEASFLPGPIWIWRFVAWGCSVLSLLLVFHSPVKVGYPFTIGLFSIYIFYWLGTELVRFTSGPLMTVFESLGKWSYSLYMMHNMVIAVFWDMDQWLTPFFVWALQTAAIFGVSYIFYLVVECPSHKLARWAARSASRAFSLP